MFTSVKQVENRLAMLVNIWGGTLRWEKSREEDSLRGILQEWRIKVP